MTCLALPRLIVLIFLTLTKSDSDYCSNFFLWAEACCLRAQQHLYVDPTCLQVWKFSRNKLMLCFGVITVKTALSSPGQQNFLVTTGVIREKVSSNCMKWHVVGCKVYEVSAACLGEKEEEGRMSSFALRSSWKPEPKCFIAFLFAAGNIRAGRQYTTTLVWDCLVKLISK